MTLADLIRSCRYLAGDSPTSNFARSENLSNNDGQANGTNLIFYVNNAPIAPGGVHQLLVDGVRIGSPYTSTAVANIDELDGQIIFASGSAPAGSIFCNYYYYLFGDNDWISFIDTAMKNMNFRSTTLTLDQDVQNVPLQFIPAVEAYVRYWYAMRVSQQTGLWYNQKLQERQEDRDSISKKWQQIATDAFKNANLMRDDAYRGSGSKEQPAFAIAQNQPRPWTPYR